MQFWFKKKRVGTEEYKGATAQDVAARPEQSSVADPSPAFCVLPWTHLYINAAGQARTCCYSKHNSNVLGDLHVQSAAEIWQGKALNRFRGDFLSGKKRPDNCQYCYAKEAAGDESMRTDMNRRHPDVAAMVKDQSLRQKLEAQPQFRHLDIRFSNACNFKCRTCGEAYSSSWRDDARALGLPRPRLFGEAKRKELLEFYLSQLPHVSQIYFAGGEPLLMPEHYIILERLIELGRTDVAILYNSNASILAWGKKNILDYWQKLRNITFSYSIDHCGVRGEMLRSGLCWQKFVENISAIREVCPHIQLKPNITVSNMNVLTLPELLEECWQTGLLASDQRDRFFINLVYSPEFFHVATLPAHLREQAVAVITGLQKKEQSQNGCKLGQLDVVVAELAKDNSGMVAQFLDFTAKLDALRSESFFTVFPELISMRQ